MPLFEFGRCVFSSRTGNQHRGDEREPCGLSEGPPCQQSKSRLFTSPVLELVKVCVSLVMLSSRRLHLTRCDIQMFLSAAAITCRTAGCPSPTKRCLCATGTSPTWFQQSTSVRWSFPVNLTVTQHQTSSRFSARTPTSWPFWCFHR